METAVQQAPSVSPTTPKSPLSPTDIPYIRDLVMTACKKGGESIVRIDRLQQTQVDMKTAYHVADGPFKGIIINRAAKALPDVEDPDVRMEFLVHMTDVNSTNGNDHKEVRDLRFWFKSQADPKARTVSAQEYFKALLQPEAFPRDYVQFIKKCIVLTQHFPMVKRIELVLKPAPEDEVDDVEPVVKRKPAPEVRAGPPPVSSAPKQQEAPPRWNIADEIIEDDDEDGEEMIENYITVLTPAVYDYQYLPEVPVSDKSHITFRLRAKCDAHIALSSVYGDTERKTYELLIGGWDNSKSVVRYGGQGEVMEETITTDILNADEFRTFWVSWDRGMVQAGEGRRRGIDTFLRWQVPDNKKHSINCLAVSSGPGSSGEWEFVEIIRPQPEDTTKAARRARFRMSLLWLAKKQKMLQVLEDAYPNSVNTGDLLKMCNIKLHDMMTSVVYLKDLQKRGLITEVTRGIWMRSPASQDRSHVVKMVETVPVLSSREIPSIAIITSQYCEKLAVDAMIESKTSYVKYKTEGNVMKGESQVYTLGRIGGHAVVSTKLSRVGSAQNASISAGNTVTRLLGIFDKVQHVLVVGCAGAVPHYSDYEKHIRLGDIVISKPGGGRSDGPIYIHCDKFEQMRNGKFDFTTNYWSSAGEAIHQQVDRMQQMATRSSYGRKPWERYIDEGNQKLHSEESNFHRPPTKKDKLFATINNEVVQVEHPKPAKGYDKNEPDNKTRVRYGPIGSGKYIARNDQLRMDFAQEFGISAYDCEFGAVLDSIEGSRTQSFLLIRGISDYVDGTRNKEWQPYASLAAAAYMKALITALPSMRRY